MEAAIHGVVYESEPEIEHEVGTTMVPNNRNPTLQILPVVFARLHWSRYLFLNAHLS